jgi:ribose 5-phosphate isomerase B
VASVVLGSDHAGFLMKSEMSEWLQSLGYRVQDVGCYSLDAVDYPDVAELLVNKINDENMGLLICGSGIGMSIAANRARHIRAAQCLDPVSARLSRLHNNANVLTLGARLVGIDMAKAIVNAFITTEFEGGRHARRVAMLGKE